MTLRCNKVNMRLWVAGLRSGNFAQTTMYLVEKTGSQWGYCCLGVACQVAMDNGVELKVRKQHSHLVFDGIDTSLPNAVLSWLGLEHENGDPLVQAQGTQMVSAISANDSLNWPFEQIADALEVTYGLLENDDEPARSD